MPKGYNGLNSIKIDWKKTGICPDCTLRLTDPKCPHATAEQIEFVRKLDGEFYSKARAVIVDETAEQVEIGGIIQWLGEPQELSLKLVQSTQRVNMLVASGAVNLDGSLKPYRPTGHASTPMTIEELGDDGQGYFNEARNG